jgi:hypothetical protein
VLGRIEDVGVEQVEWIERQLMRDPRQPPRREERVADVGTIPRFSRFACGQVIANVSAQNSVITASPIANTRECGVDDARLTSSRGRAA